MNLLIVQNDDGSATPAGVTNDWLMEEIARQQAGVYQEPTEETVIEEEPIDEALIEDFEEVVQEQRCTPAWRIPEEEWDATKAQALKIGFPLWKLRWPHSSISEGDYVFNEEEGWKVSLQTGAFWKKIKEEEGYDDYELLLGSDVIWCWLAVEGVHDMRGALRVLQEDIRWLTEESPEAREQRAREDAKKAREELEDRRLEAKRAVFELVFEPLLKQEPGIITITANARELYKACINPEFCSSYEYKEFLEDWAAGKDDLWYLVEEIPNPRKKARSLFKLTTTGVTTSDVLVRQVKALQEGKRLPRIKTQLERHQQQAEKAEQRRQAEIEMQAATLKKRMKQLNCLVHEDPDDEAARRAKSKAVWEEFKDLTDPGWKKRWEKSEKKTKIMQAIDELEHSYRLECHQKGILSPYQGEMYERYHAEWQALFNQLAALG